MRTKTKTDELISHKVETAREAFLSDLKKMVAPKKAALEAERAARSSSKKSET